jgi:hypothetical protein
VNGWAPPNRSEVMLFLLRDWWGMASNPSSKPAFWWPQR